MPPNSDWTLLKEDASDLIKSSFWGNSKAHEILDNNVIKYFPADRTDKPAWENNDTTSEKDDFQRLSEYSNISNRQIIIIIHKVDCVFKIRRPPPFAKRVYLVTLCAKRRTIHCNVFALKDKICNFAIQV